jgi:hypothetical protein
MTAVITPEQSVDIYDKRTFAGATQAGRLLRRHADTAQQGNRRRDPRRPYVERVHRAGSSVERAKMARGPGLRCIAIPWPRGSATVQLPERQ